MTQSPCSPPGAEQAEVLPLLSVKRKPAVHRGLHAICRPNATQMELSLRIFDVAFIAYNPQTWGGGEEKGGKGGAM